MKNASILITAIAIAFVVSCKKEEVQLQVRKNSTKGETNYARVSSQQQRSVKGIESAIPALHDSTIFRVLLVEFRSKAEASLFAHNGNINLIYQSDELLPNEQPFISVIDAIPTDGMTAVWRKVLIDFNRDFVPHQFYSDEEILAAATGPDAEITLIFTNEIYRGPVLKE